MNHDRERATDLALKAIAVASGLLPVASAMALHATSYPVALGRVLAVAAVVVPLSLLFYAVAGRMSRSTRCAAAAVMTWWLLIFLYPLVARLGRRAMEATTVEAFEFSYVALATLLSWLVLRSRRIAGPLDVLLSTFFVVTLATTIAGSLPHYFARSPFRASSRLWDDRRSEMTARPNIYHLVLDGLGRGDVLKARYDLDLSGPASTLRSLGYIVEEDAASNYAHTYLSIASMLNAAYIEVPGARIEEHSRRPLHDAIQDNNVFSTLRLAGYEISFLASDYSATTESRQATSCWCPPTLFGEFESTVLYATPFRAWFPGSFDYIPHDARTEQVLARFAASVSSRRGMPRYTFAHVLSPHPPFVRQNDGTFSPPRRAFSFRDGTMYPGAAAEYRNGYAQQARYIMRRVVEIASTLQREDPTAVVIISGDHGPRLRFDAADARRTDAGEVLPIFLAIRWGASGPAAARMVGTLVNLYREILRRYLNVPLPQLPNRSYVSSFRTPYDLLEVDRRRLEP
jgi:hypothetical protein